MVIFGWIALVVLAILGVGLISLYITPYIASEICSLTYRIKRAIEDKKEDTDKISEARRKRYEIKRQKQNELADKKLEVKLKKVAKQIEIYEKKIKLTEELKQSAEQVKKELTAKNEAIIEPPVELTLTDEPIIIDKIVEEIVENTSTEE